MSTSFVHNIIHRFKTSLHIYGPYPLIQDNFLYTKYQYISQDKYKHKSYKYTNTCQNNNTKCYDDKVGTSII